MFAELNTMFAPVVLVLLLSLSAVEGGLTPMHDADGKPAQLLGLRKGREPWTWEHVTVPRSLRNAAATALAEDPSLVAVADYRLGMMTTGWDDLVVTTQARYADEDQAYAAGWVEGHATAQAIWYNWLNTFAMQGNGSWVPPSEYMPTKAVTFVQANLDYVAKQVAASNHSSLYWYQVGLQMLQLNGMVDGYNAAVAASSTRRGPRSSERASVASPPAPAPLAFMDILFMGMAGDLMDIFTALGIMTDESATSAVAQLLRAASATRNWRNMSRDDFNTWFAQRTHCSSLVKVANDFSDIWIGHATWSTYNQMYRIFKTYTLNYNASRSGAATVSFSSYPACLSSIDDFYTTSAGLVITETTFNVYNTSIYDGNIGPQGVVMYWVRSQVASRMASSAEQWAKTFVLYNSGTYNNGWTVLDTKLFAPKQPFQAGTLWLAEQFPGRVYLADVTEVLGFAGFFPGFNVPFSHDLFVYAGYPEAVATQGVEMNSYDRNVRMQIFRRDHHKVVDTASMQHIMQYNDYTHDPVSEGNAVYAVASRGDLVASSPQCWGAVDAKLTSFTAMTRAGGAQISAYSGPTPQQPVFNFNTTNATMMCTPHFGVPTLWNNPWVTFTMP